jgi:hypothetical protein
MRSAFPGKKCGGEFCVALASASDVGAGNRNPLWNRIPNAIGTAGDCKLPVIEAADTEIGIPWHRLLGDKAINLMLS